MPDLKASLPAAGWFRIAPAVLGSLLFLLPFVGCTSDERSASATPSVDSTDTRSHDLSSLIGHHEDLSRLEDALQAADLHRTLSEIGPYTVFAPTNDALDRSVPTLDSLIATSADTLRTILEQHLVRGTIDPPCFRDSVRVSNLQNRPLLLTRPQDGESVIEGHPVRLTQHAQNGVLHIVDAVLEPELPDLPPQSDPRESPETPAP